MLTLKTLPALAVLAIASLALVPACAVAQADGTDGADSVTGTDNVTGADDTDGDEGVAAEAETRAGKACTTDSSCDGYYCAPHCPVIPGRLHCEIPGGSCAARCTRSSTSLHGHTFASTDAAHSIKFASNGTFTKTDGCAPPSAGGITCEHIELTTGTYASSSTGKTVKLTSNLGTVETLSVETHCYEGLHDPGTGAILYPAP